MISWLPYPWQQRTARIVKVQDYEVMVHKGLGSDKVVCGSESGDFRSTETSFFLIDDEGHITAKHQNMCFQISLI